MSGLHRGLIVALIVSAIVWLLVVWLVAEPTIDAVTVKAVPSQEHAAHVRTAEVASLWQDLHTQAVIDEYLREHHRAELAARERQKARRAAQQARSARVRTAAAPTVRGDLVDALARCESNMNPRAYNPAGPYFSFFQWSLSTWRKAGGQGHPYDAPYATQKRLAISWAAKTSWGSQWPVCARKVGLA